MKKGRFRVLAWAMWGVGIAALGTFGWWMLDSFTARENILVEWALRLPKERERARIAGFTGSKRIAPRFDPAKDAGIDWVRIEAMMLADSSAAKLPDMDEALSYANPRLRATADRAAAMRLLNKYRAFLSDAERASRKPCCYFPYHPGNDDLSGVAAAKLLAALHLVASVEASETGNAQAAIDHARSALRIARQMQAHNTWYPFDAGVLIEIVTLRIIRERLVERDEVKQGAARQAFAGQAEEFLQSPPHEPSPTAQFRLLIQNDHLLLQEALRNLRLEKYNPRNDLFMESAPVLRLINRLDFILAHRATTDAVEATNDWYCAGLAMHLRGREMEQRPYALWKATQEWERHVNTQMANAPKVIVPYESARFPLLRVTRDTDRALTQVVWQQVCRRVHPRIPDDPFAPQPNTPLRRHDKPDGTTIWYSVGVDGKDDGGDAKKDRIAVVPPVKQASH